MVLQIVLFYLGLFMLIKGNSTIYSIVLCTRKASLFMHSFMTLCALLLSFFVRQSMLFSAFRRANRALFCVLSCAKQCSFLRFVVHQIVFFCAFRRAPNRALTAFCRAPNRAQEFLSFFKTKVALDQAKNCRTVWVGKFNFQQYSSCTKWCPKSCDCYRPWARHNICIYITIYIIVYIYIYK